MCPKIAHNLIFVHALHATMQETQPQIWKDRLTQALVFNSRSLNSQRFGLFYQRTNNKRLPTLCNLLGDEIVGFVALIACPPPGDNFLTARRGAIDDRDIPVALKEQP